MRTSAGRPAFKRRAHSTTSAGDSESGAGATAGSDASLGETAAAESGGTVGPDLDEVLSGQSAAMVNEDIVDPNKVIAKGYPANVMPLNFEETLSPEELEDLVQYLVESTGGKEGAPKGGQAGGSKPKGG